MFDETYAGLLSLDLDKLKKRAEEVAGHWNGESLRFVGADGDVYSDEDAQVMNDIIKVVEELESLLEQAGCKLDKYTHQRIELSIAASRLGSITSPQKAKSSAKNGKKGGRPKKDHSELDQDKK